MLWKAPHGRTSSRSEARGGTEIKWPFCPPLHSWLCYRSGAPRRQGPAQGVPPRMGGQGKCGATATGYRWSGLGAESGERRPDSTVGEGDWVERNKSPSTKLSPVSSFNLMDSEGTCSRQGRPPPRHFFLEPHFGKNQYDPVYPNTVLTGVMFQRTAPTDGGEIPWEPR